MIRPMSPQKKVAKRKPGRPIRQRASWNPDTFQTLCEALGVRWSEVAQELGVSEKTVYRWKQEDTQWPPTPEQAELIAQYLGRLSGLDVSAEEMGREITGIEFTFS